MLDPNAPILDIPEKIRESIIQVFLEEAQELIDQINSGYSEPNLVVLKSAAHKLKGSSSTIGAKELSLLARQIEAIEFPSEELILDINSMFSKLRDELGRD